MPTNSVSVSDPGLFGNPGETVESMQRTTDYALELDPDLAIFNITTPYPGTELFEWARSNGCLNTEDWGEGSARRLGEEHYYRADPPGQTCADEPAE
jgi:hypothetical protein